MFKISVITPTLRPESLSLMRDCLKNQTFRDFEWLVDINITGEHDLNKSFNNLIKRSSGELIVFYEDYTKIPPNALEKWWKAYQEHSNVCWTAPLGKVKSLDFKGEVKWDWRAWVNDTKVLDYRPSSWQTCELDWGAIPRKVLLDIGGFDERLDQWWSCDNLSVGKRAYLKGYEFKNLFTNPAIAYDHDAFIEHPFRARYNPKEVEIIMGEYTPESKLPYLNRNVV